MTTFDSTFAKTIEAQTELVLSSSYFSRSVLLTRFLRFAVRLSLEGKSHELKEYRLGLEVFERGNSFDPRVDPVVRVQAAKLRAKLAEYYAAEGRNDACVISIPRGGYAPVFTRTEPPPTNVVPTTEQANHPSIAVLLFVSMSGNGENAYFCDGLTEELINVLAYAPGLHVASRTSVFCFKNAVKDIREIGPELGARTVLEGSVRKAGTQVRVTAQLIDVATGYHLLSRTFLREFKGEFALQEELASAIVSEIMPKLRTESRPAAQGRAVGASWLGNVAHAGFTQLAACAAAGIS